MHSTYSLQARLILLVWGKSLTYKVLRLLHDLRKRQILHQVLTRTETTHDTGDIHAFDQRNSRQFDLNDITLTHVGEHFS